MENETLESRFQLFEASIPISKRNCYLLLFLPLFIWTTTMKWKIRKIDFLSIISNCSIRLCTVEWMNEILLLFLVADDRQWRVNNIFPTWIFGLYAHSIEFMILWPSNIKDNSFQINDYSGFAVRCCAFFQAHFSIAFI